MQCLTTVQHVCGDKATYTDVFDVLVGLLLSRENISQLAACRPCSVSTFFLYISEEHML